MDLLNKWSEESLTTLFNTNAPIKSILIKAINEFKKHNPDNHTYKFLEQALENSWDHYEYNEYYMYSDSDGYYAPLKTTMMWRRIMGSALAIFQNPLILWRTQQKSVTQKAMTQKRVS